MSFNPKNSQLTSVHSTAVVNLCRCLACFGQISNRGLCSTTSQLLYCNKHELSGTDYENNNSSTAMRKGTISGSLDASQIRPSAAFHLRLAGKCGIHYEKVTIGIVVLVNLEPSYQHHIPRKRVLLCTHGGKIAHFLGEYTHAIVSRTSSIAEAPRVAQVVVLMSCGRVSRDVVGHKSGCVDSKSA